VTTSFTHLGIEQLHISTLRPEGPIPRVSAIDINKAQINGLCVLPTIKIRLIKNDQYELIEGLITWRAAQYLRIDSIDAQILNIDDDLAREMISDDFAPCQKKRNPIHEARAIKELAQVESITPTRVGSRLNHDRYYVSILMRILKLPKSIQEHIESNRLPVGKAKMLLTLSSDLQYDMAEKAMDEHWSTRRMEEEIRTLKQAKPSATNNCHQQPKTITSNQHHEQDPEIKREQDRLEECVGSPIHIDHDAKTGHGKIVISYSNLDIFTGIAERLETAPTPQPGYSDWDDERF